MNTEQLTATPDQIGRRPANWKRFRLSMNKAEHLAERARCIDMRNQCRVAYVAAYTAAALTLGEGGPFTGIPGAPKVPEATMVSGGTWSHWPHPVKDAVAKYIRASHEWEDRALLHHRAAGLRTSTFRNTWGRSI